MGISQVFSLFRVVYHSVIHSLKASSFALFYRFSTLKTIKLTFSMLCERIRKHVPCFYRVIEKQFLTNQRS